MKVEYSIITINISREKFEPEAGIEPWITYFTSSMKTITPFNFKYLTYFLSISRYLCLVSVNKLKPNNESLIRGRLMLSNNCSAVELVSKGVMIHIFDRLSDTGKSIQVEQ